MTFTKTFSLALIGGVSSLALIQPATALDAQSFADRLTAVYERVGYAVDIPSAKLKGDTILLDNIRIGVLGMEDVAQITTSLTFSGVSEAEDGSYWAQTVTAPDVDYEIREEVPGHLSLTDITITDFYLPPGDDTGALAMMQLFGEMRTGPLSVTRKGAEVISFSSMDFTATYNPEQGAHNLQSLTSVFAINDIDIDLSSLSEEDPQAAAVIGALGLTRINGDITQRLDWDMTTGRMGMGEFLFDFADIGSLDIAMDLSGFTPALLDQLYDMQGQMLAEGTDPNSEEAQARQMIVGMQMAQAIVLNSIQVRYEDASLANKLIDFFASAQGIERAQMIEGVKAMVPEMVAGMGVPALEDMLAAPLAAFLDDPRSFEVAVEPAKPASLLVLTAAATNPAGLVELLGLRASANDAE